MNRNIRYPFTTRLVSKIFLGGLLALSLLSSALLLTDNLNNIQLKHQLQDQKLTALENFTKEKIAALQERQKQERQQFNTQQIQSMESLNQDIAALERSRQLEMNNVVNGTFKGERYAEYQAQYAARLQEKETLRTRQLNELRIHEADLAHAYQQEEALLLQQEAQKKQNLLEMFNPNDPRTNDPMVVSFLMALESMNLPWMPTPSQFIFLFAFMLSLLMELGIVLAFENVVLALSPILKLRLQGEIEQELLKTQLDNEQEKDSIQHEADLDAIRRQAGQQFKKAKVWVEEGILPT